MAGVTMRAVADRVGVTATSLYRHFRDKDSLVAELRNQIVALFRSRIPEATAAETSEQQLRESLEALPAFAREYPCYFDFVFAARQGLAGNQPDRSDPVLQLLVARVQDCIKDGILREDDPLEVTLTLLAHALGLVIVDRRYGFRTDPEALAVGRASLERVLRGLA